MSKRAELRRQQKQQNSGGAFQKVLFPVAPLTPEKVSKSTGLPLQDLLDWRTQEHEQLEKQICREYRFKLERAEDLIQAACIFAMINTFWGLYKIKFNSDKVIDKYHEEVEKAFTHGITDAYNRAKKLSGLEFEFEDFDLNAEFHVGDYKFEKKLSEMKSGEAYSQGWDDASILGNIINTLVFANQLHVKGFEVEEIQKLIIEANSKASSMRIGDGKVTKFAEELKEKGIYVGDYNMEMLAKFSL